MAKACTHTNPHHILALPILATLAGATAIALQLHNSFWAVITVIVIMSDTINHPLIKAFLRITGTLLGAVLGCLLCILFADQSLVRFCLFLMVILIGAYWSHKTVYHYAFILGLATFFIVTLTSWISAQQVIPAAIWRSTEVILGVVIVAIYQVIFSHRLAKPDKLLSVNTNQALRSIKITMAAGLTALAWFYTGWYGGVVGVVSSLLVALGDTHELSIKVSLERLLGCLIGALFAWFIICFVPHNMLFILLTIFCAGLIYTGLMHYLPQFHYAELQGFVAFLIALLPANNQLSESLGPAFERVGGILLGVIVGLLVCIAFQWLISACSNKAK